MKKISCVWTQITADKTHTTADDLKPVESGTRARQVYGEEKLRQQLLYEHWAVKDTWHIRKEALPLLFGIDPATYTINDNSLPEEEAIKALWSHARQCIDHDLLHVTNMTAHADDWQVEPLGIYQWAVISRLHVPDPLVALMDFVGRTIKRSPQPALHADALDGGNISSAFDADREKVLGMALAVLATLQEKCRNASGEIKAELLAGVCKEEFRRQGYKLKLADGAMIDLIHKWLNVLQ